MKFKAAFNFKSGLLRRIFSFTIAWLLAVAMSFGAAQNSPAQMAVPDVFGQQEAAGPPPGVERYGNVEAVKVESPLTSRILLTIASPTVHDRSPEEIGDRQTVEQRAQEIRAKLLLLLQRPMDPNTLVFEVSTLRNLPVISVRDATYTQPLILASVTKYDVDFNGLPADELAKQWRDALEADLRNGLAKLPADRRRVYRVVMWLMVLTIFLLALKYFLHQRQRHLRQQKKAIQAKANLGISQGSEPQNEIDLQSSVSSQVQQKRLSFLRVLQQKFTLDQQLSTLDAIQWLLFWLLILTWSASIIWIEFVSPYLLIDSLGFFRIAVDILLVWFFTGLAIRLSRRLIDHFTTEREGLDLGDFITFGDTQRRQLRASTIAGAAKGLVTILIILLGILTVLRSLGVSAASVVAITSLAGLAITFGSQNLVKDLVNGFFILAEDQYAIGDVIEMNGAAGLVENLNLRVTQIRSASGDLITIPNSSVTQVKNLTRSWSRVAFSIDVAYGTDPDKALDVLNEVARTFYEDPTWHDKMINEPSVLGIDSVSHSGMTITTWIQTEPAEQWAVGREFRLRVRRAFDQYGIDIGTPRQTYRLESSGGSNTVETYPAAESPEKWSTP